MMKLTKYFCLICVFQFLGFSIIKCKAEQFNLPDSLFHVGAYKASAIEYEYIYYSFTDNVVKTKALLGKSASLKKLGLFSESVKSLERVRFDGLPDSIAYAVLYETALCAYITMDFGYAESQLLQMQLYINDTALKNDALPLFVMVLNEQKKWKEAENKLELCLIKSKKVNISKDSIIRIVRSVYIDTPRVVNINKAIKLSSFIPGSGQIYLGYWSEGFVNASLQLGSLAFIGYNLISAQYFTAITLGTGILQRFYVGGVNRVKYLGNKKNDEMVRKFNDQVKKIIIQISLN